MKKELIIALEVSVSYRSYILSYRVELVGLAGVLNSFRLLSELYSLLYKNLKRCNELVATYSFRLLSELYSLL